MKQTAKRKKDSAKAIKKDEKVVEVPAETLQKFVGSYELAPRVLFTVKVDGEKLMIGLTGQPSNQVFPRSETEWFYKVVDATITFNLDKNGKCDSLVLFQNGAKQTAKRKKVAAEATKKKKEEKAIDVPAEALEKFVGNFELAPGAVFTVEADDGKLMISLTGQPSLQVHPRSQRVWFYKEVDATITFNIDNKGKCNSLVLNQNGKKQTAKRKK